MCQFSPIGELFLIILLFVSKEELDTKLNIQEALVLMIDAFRNCSIDQKNLVLKMLFQYVQNVCLMFNQRNVSFNFGLFEKDVPQCRSMAVKYAFEIFDNDHLESRFLLILASSDS